MHYGSTNDSTSDISVWEAAGTDGGRELGADPGPTLNGGPESQIAGVMTTLEKGWVLTSGKHFLL